MLEKLDNIEKEDRTQLFSFDYWARKTDWSYEEVSNQVAKTPLEAIYPQLLEKLQYYSDLVIKGAYYWLNRDITYLKLVYETIIPSVRKHEDIIRVNYDGNDFKNPESFHLFILDLKKKHYPDI